MPIPALEIEAQKTVSALLGRKNGTAVPTLWSERFAQRTQRMTSSVIRELLKLTEQPEVISFAGGLPAPEVFPVAEIERATETVLREQGRTALQYAATEGYLPLRELLVRQMARYGIKVTPANVLITSGSQQGLDLIGKLFVNPGDRILTESPTYLGALQAWSAYQADYLTVPVDDDGLDVDRLEAQLRGGPKFLYVLPNFQNPSGVTLSLERRRRLVELANHYGAPIVEDDPYGQLRYEGEHLPPIVQIDAEFHDCANGECEFTGDVLYLSTLSKTLAPGLRIAWVVAPESVISRLVQMKQGADLHTQHLLPDGGLRGGQGRLPRPPREDDPRALRRAPERDAGRAGAALPGGGALDEAAGRPLPLDHAARGLRLDRASSRKRSRGRRSPSCRARPSSRGAAGSAPAA